MQILEGENFGGKLVQHTDKYWKGEFVVIMNVCRRLNNRLGGIKYWQIIFDLPNLTKFSPPEFSAICMVCDNLRRGLRCSRKFPYVLRGIKHVNVRVRK